MDLGDVGNSLSQLICPPRDVVLDAMDPTTLSSCINLVERILRSEQSFLTKTHMTPVSNLWAIPK